MATLAALFSISSGLGYLLPAIIGLESMGVPSPGETALILAAVLASQGKLNIELVIVIGIASAIIGDNVGYWIGRRLGREALEAPGPLQTRRKRIIAVGDMFFERHGPKAVFLARWVALVRVAAAWLAGINKMKFSHFFLWNAAGAITWATTVSLVGYFGGQKVADAITKYGLIAVVALVVLIVAFFAFTKWRERRREALAKTEADERESVAVDGSAPEPGERQATELEPNPSTDS
jgi:membrane protein DedA with SNARE-associated domain